MNNKNNETTYNFVFTEDQQEAVCKHYGKDKSQLDDYEICELLDRLIDDYVTEQYLIIYKVEAITTIKTLYKIIKEDIYMKRGISVHGIRDEP